MRTGDIAKLTAKVNRYYKRIAEGKCPWYGCSEKPQPGKRYCAAHARWMSEKAEALRVKRRAAGLCYLCCTPYNGKTYVCTKCGLYRLQQKNARLEARRAGQETKS
jgi:hypothetical protein